MLLLQAQSSTAMQTHAACTVSMTTYTLYDNIRISLLSLKAQVAEEEFMLVPRLPHPSDTWLVAPVSRAGPAQAAAESPSVCMAGGGCVVALQAGASGQGAAPLQAQPAAAGLDSLVSWRRDVHTSAQVCSIGA